MRTRIEQETEAADTLENATARARHALTSYNARARNTAKGIGRIQGYGVAATGVVATVIAQGTTLMVAGLAMAAVGVLLFLVA